MAIKDNVAFYEKVGALLTKWGWPVEYWGGWKTRTNGTTVVDPTALTVHHTGGVSTSTGYLVNPTDRPQLKVLANVHITRSHKIYILAAGTTSHGGYTHKACYDHVVQGTAPLDRDLVPGSDSSTFSINRYTVGLEVDGAGGASEWDDWMKQAVLAFAVACEIVAGWSKDGKNPRVGAHKEHTKRKPGDPHMNMGTLRTNVKRHLAQPVTPPGLPKPPDPPVTPVDHKMRVGTYNTQLKQFGGGPNAEDVQFVKKTLKVSVLAAQECAEDKRYDIGGECGYKWYSHKALGLFWDPKKFKHGSRIYGSFPDPSKYQGYVGTELTSLQNGERFVAVNVHVRPNDAIKGTAAQKLAGKTADIKQVIKALAGYKRVVVMGDFSTSHSRALMENAGYRLATPFVDTMDRAGDQKVDQIWVRGLEIRDGSIIKTSASDHHAGLGNLTLLAPVSSN